MICLLICVCFILVLASCNDIVDSDKNILIVPVGDSELIKANIEFYFANELVTLHNNDTTALWNAFQGNAWAKSFGVINRSKDTVLTISNIQLEDNSDFTLSYSQTLPIDLESNNKFDKLYILINLDNININKGIYYNRVIINDNQDIGFTFKILVN